MTLDNPHGLLARAGNHVLAPARRPARVAVLDQQMRDADFVVIVVAAAAAAV